jgi:hypothetical protein
MWPHPICSECGKQFNPHRDRIFDKEASTCGKPECQRKRKTRLQRERREMKQRPAGDCLAKQRGYTLPLKQRRPTLPQPPEVA